MKSPRKIRSEFNIVALNSIKEDHREEAEVIWI